MGDYVKTLDELEILEGVPQAIKVFRSLFGRIVVVTNQQGIGKGLMTSADLKVIHDQMNLELSGAIDKFYHAPQLAAENHIDRKPGIGMGLQSKNDYPEIDFSKSLMIGDSESDIEFGMNLEMKTIMLKTERNQTSKADYIFKNLLDVSKSL